MLSDGEIDRIATAVARKMAEAELDRLREDLAFEERLAAHEADRRRLAARSRRRRLRWPKVAVVAVFALVYVMTVEAL